MPPPLATLTTFRLGGPPADFAEAADAPTAAAAIRRWNDRGLPWRALGGGSNILAGDDSLPFAVLRAILPPGPAAPREEAPGVWSFPAAAPLDAIARWAVETLGDEAWAFASGIPGTLGGAVVGNAGAFGRAVGDLVAAVEAVLPDASSVLLRPPALAFAYRASSLQSLSCFVARIHLRATPSPDPAPALARRAEILALRRAKHPDPAVTPTAGSFFKNLPPAPGADRRAPAGALLDAVGAKSLSVGRARVYPLHANILVADSGATAADVASLAALLAARVLDRFSVALSPEVRYWGLLPAPLPPQPSHNQPGKAFP